MKRQRSGLAVGAAIVAASWPASASAHLVTTGMGPVYDGIGHLLLTPEDLVPALALAIYAGLRGPAAGRRVTFALPAAWWLGGVAGAWHPVPIAAPVAALWFLSIGGLVASDAPLPTPVVTILSVALGLVAGFGEGMALTGIGPARALAGNVTAVFFSTTLTAAFVISMRRPWMRVATRVVGSWIAATGLLMVGWALR